MSELEWRPGGYDSNTQTSCLACSDLIDPVREEAFTCPLCGDWPLCESCLDKHYKFHRFMAWQGAKQ